MAVKRSAQAFVYVLAILFTGSLLTPCLADEIRFKNPKGSQTGTVVEEDEQSVTIRFPKTSITSVTRDRQTSPTAASERIVMEEKGDYLILKIPRQGIQVVTPTTEATAEAKPVKASPTQESSAKVTAETTVPVQKASEESPVKATLSVSTAGTTHEKLMKEEAGSVEGTILWQGKPVSKGRVKIVMENYTGFSPAALKKVFSSAKDKSEPQEVTLETETDATGHYAFADVPPGSYRIYWMVTSGSGWMRRLQEKPDFEVTAGGQTVHNIPTKKQ